MTALPNTNSGEKNFANDPELLSDVLRPYARPKTQYLKSATVTVSDDGLASAEGRFAIPFPCYIDDTGHLNAVEVIICFNQLMYYLIAKCVQERTVPAFDTWSMEDYWAKQLPDILIARFQSNFKRPIDSADFSGSVSFTEFTETNRSRPVLKVDMPWRFWDAGGGYAEGAVGMALVDPPGMALRAA